MTIPIGLARLGQFFHDYRSGRGVSLTAAASGFSPATLSRFERGHQDISAAKAQRLIDALGLEPQDFLPLLTEAPEIFPFMARGLVEGQAQAALLKRQHAFAAAHPTPSGLTTLADAWFAAALHWAEPTFRLSPAAEQRLADFLVVPENLTPLEEGIRAALIAPASHELLEILWQRSERMTHNLRKDYRGVLLIDYWLSAAANRDTAFLAAHQAELTAELAAHGHLNAYRDTLPRWRFAQRLATWVQAPTPAHAAAVTAYLDAERAVGHLTAATYYAALYAHAQAGQPAHDPALVDHFGTLNTSQTAGGVLAQRLRLFGVTPEDLPSDRDPSTLRRYMNGQSQLGFGAMTQVSAELALLPQTLLMSAGGTAQHVGHKPGLYSYWYQITDCATVAAAEQLYQQFCTDAALLPTPIATAQDFILQATLSDQFAVTPTIDLAKRAQAAFAQLVQSNRWGVQEGLTIKYLAEWLAASDLPLFCDRVARRCRDYPDDINGDFYHAAIATSLKRLTTTAPALATQLLAALARDPLDQDTAPAWEQGGAAVATAVVLGDSPHAALTTWCDRARTTGQYVALDAVAALWGDHFPADTFAHPAWDRAFHS